ncbi:PRC-barrel domain-containing protein [Arenibaculum sp.]|uniref:PRC-barrel domain-containing protein n=1 Tax=Arenibaculum sp. TaxID=2865862 RepID=UPI002E10E987|nr:PRC-barrel domain-containing protein [Arenibaculum sp.]
MRYLPPLAASTLLLASALPALAQTGETIRPAPPSAIGQLERIEIDPGLREMDPAALEGMRVYDAQGEEVGDVETVMIGTDRRLLAVVETQGWLGVATGRVAIPVEAMRLDGDVLRLVALTEEQVRDIMAEKALDYGTLDGYATIGEAWDARLVE